MKRILLMALAVTAILSGTAQATDWQDMVMQNNYATSAAPAAGTLIWTGQWSEVKLPGGQTMNACVYLAPHRQIVVLENSPCAAAVTL